MIATLQPIWIRWGCWMKQLWLALHLDDYRFSFCPQNTSEIFPLSNRSVPESYHLPESRRSHLKPHGKVVKWLFLPFPCYLDSKRMRLHHFLLLHFFAKILQKWKLFKFLLSPLPSTNVVEWKYPQKCWQNGCFCPFFFLKRQSEKRVGS